ncbi:hypothetical protein QJS83_05915 [Bdellovibrio sp. 22V]|uniref:hypothetical protein n=1 Tax=Bdellovibrio TaxID=958 RepID=UPI002543BF2A|nr:hypothetical protein [Bdellovibrio sp. 22V]WII73404.1 hypothetical protein QJS83_05915 [Bdellovibrio sp. 22V]
MKSVMFVFLSLFLSLSCFAEQLELPLEPKQCIEINQAKAVLNNYLAPLVGQSLNDEFYWIIDGEYTLTTDDVKRALKSLTWNAKSFKYQTSAIIDGYCAAGASCWGWYTVDCAGKIDALVDGED